MPFPVLRFLALFVSGCVSAPAVLGSDVAAGGEIQLFNGRNLQGLTVYREESTIEPDAVWKVEDGLLRCTGISRGYIRTNMGYADYRLRVEWRWPNGAGNSGVLLHIVNGDLLWPKCFEAQLASGRAGDFASFLDARSSEEAVGRNPRGFSTGRLARQGPSAEKPVGEWNIYEIVAEGDTITLFVNGVEVNRMTGVRPAAGMIGLQAEGAAIDFRGFTLTRLPPAKDTNAPIR